MSSNELNKIFIVSIDTGWKAGWSNLFDLRFYLVKVDIYKRFRFNYDILYIKILETFMSPVKYFLIKSSRENRLPISHKSRTNLIFPGSRRTTRFIPVTYSFDIRLRVTHKWNGRCMVEHGHTIWSWLVYSKPRKNGCRYEAVSGSSVQRAGTRH